ncbi:hypothetical protein NQ317_015413, partial [Molorchus minor]
MRVPISVPPAIFDSQYTKENTTVETVGKYSVPNVANLKYYKLFKRNVGNINERAGQLKAHSLVYRG